MTISQDVISFSLESSFDTPANRFSATLAKSAAFIASLKRTGIDIDAGYKDASGAVSTIRVLANGIIDSYSLSLNPNEAITSIRGRDSVAEILDTYYEKIYSPNPNKFKDKFGNVTTNLNVQVSPTGPAHTIPISSQTRASLIAKEIIESLNLTMQWDCRDYIIQSDFDATGRAIDILKKLVEPWNITELLRVDIYAEGSVIFIKQRLGTYSPNYTYAASNAKIKNFSVDKKPSVTFGRIILEGGAFGSGVTGSNTGLGGSSFSGSDDNERFREIKTLDENAKVIAVTTIREKFRKPDGVLLEYEEKRVDLNVLTKRETRFQEWDDPEIGADGQINQALINSVISTTEEIDKKSSKLTPTKKNVITYAYDGNKKLDEETETRSDFDTKKLNWIAQDRVVKQYSDYNSTQVQLITTTYQIDSKTKKLRVITIDTQVNSGQRPGGTNPPGGIFVQGSNDPNDRNVTRESVRYEKIVSTDKYAVPFQFSNPNLTLLDLQFIMAQLESISGGWVYEVSWTSVSMPWLKKGRAVRFTSIALEGGLTYNINGALIISSSLRGTPVDSIGQYSAQYWSSS